MPFKPVIQCLFAVAVLLACSNSLVATQLPQYIDRLPSNALKSLGLQGSTQVEFSPAQNETVGIVFSIEKPGAVSLSVLSADGDFVRQLADGDRYDAGTHTILWDGKDDTGLLVPDEAYIPRFEWQGSNEESVVDLPTRYSGGEILPDVDWQRGGNSDIVFELPEPARVLVRTGVDDGPMINELRHWDPIASGRVVVRWDGYDAQQIDKIGERDDLWVLVMAYQLPQYSVVTRGNNELDYRTYRQLRAWPIVIPDLANIPLQRNGVRLSRDYFMPRNFQPRVSFQFEDIPAGRLSGVAIAGKNLRLRVDIPKEDRWILDTSFYETSFYINYKFQSEEEQGFVPMIWDYHTELLDPGRYVATVQLFGFGGFITSSSVEFLVLK